MLRDKFAMAAMQAILGDAETWKNFIQTSQKTGMKLNDVVAVSSYEFADAMMKARKDVDFSDDPDAERPKMFITPNGDIDVQKVPSQRHKSSRGNPVPLPVPPEVEAPPAVATINV